MRKMSAISNCVRGGRGTILGYSLICGSNGKGARNMAAATALASRLSNLSGWRRRDEGLDDPGAGLDDPVEDRGGAVTVTSKCRPSYRVRRRFSKARGAS